MTTYFISQAYIYIQVEVTEEAFTFHLCKADLHLPLQHTLTDLWPAEMKDDYDSRAVVSGVSYALLSLNKNAAEINSSEENHKCMHLSDNCKLVFVHTQER